MFNSCNIQHLNIWTKYILHIDIQCLWCWFTWFLSIKLKVFSFVLPFLYSSLPVSLHLSLHTNGRLTYLSDVLWLLWLGLLPPCLLEVVHHLLPILQVRKLVISKNSEWWVRGFGWLRLRYYTKLFEVDFHRPVGVKLVEEDFDFEVLVDLLVQGSQVDDHVLQVNDPIVLLVYRLKQLLVCRFIEIVK